MLRSALDELALAQDQARSCEQKFLFELQKRQVLQEQLIEAEEAKQGLEQSCKEVAKRIGKLEAMASQYACPGVLLDHSHSTSMSVATTQALTLELDTLRRENDQLKCRVGAEYNEKSLQTTRLKQIIEKEEEDRQAELQKRQMYLSEIERLTARNRCLEENAEQLGLQLSELRAELDEVRDEQLKHNSTMSQRVQYMEAELHEEDSYTSRLAYELTEVQQSGRRLVKENLQLASDLAGTRRELSAARQESERMEHELKRTLVRLGERDQQLGLLLAEHRSLKQEYEALLLHAAREEEKAGGAVTELESRLTELQQVLESQAHNYEQATKDLVQQLHYAEGQKRKVCQQLKMLQRSHDQLERRLGDSDLRTRQLANQLEKERSERSRVAEELGEERRQLVLRVEQAEHNSAREKRHFQTTFGRMEEEFKELRIRFERSLDELLAEVRQLQQQKQGLVEELDSASQSRDKLSAKLDSALADIKFLEERYSDDARSSLETNQLLRDNLQSAQDQLAQRNDLCLRLRGQLSTVEVLVEKLRDDLQFQKNVKGHIEEQLGYEKRRNHHLEELYSRARSPSKSLECSGRTQLQR